MTTAEVVKKESARQVVTLTLNRPDTGNACDAATLARLAEELQSVATDTSIRMIVLRGVGRHFCSGADVRAPRPSAGEPGVSFFQVCGLLDSLTKPTIAVVHGGCIGGGVALAACCDVVLAAQNDAFFALPEVRLGLAPGPLLLYFARAMGERAVRRYLLTGERFTARTAHEFGLVQAVYPEAELESGLDAVIDALLLGAPGAIGRAKAMLAKHGAAPMTAEVVGAIEAEFHKQAASDEAQEGRLSFREKRKPSWYPKPQ
jgi:methylglutaconyl-CoA hydratase